MDIHCVICKNRQKSNNSEIHNVRINTTKYSNIPMLIFIENITGNTIISDEYDTCNNCYDLINELDLIQKRYEIIRKKLISYLECNETDEKTTPTGDFLESILEVDIQEKQSVNDSMGYISLDSRKYTETVIDQLETDKHKTDFSSELYECHVCSKKFFSKSGISSHRKNKHNTKINEKELTDCSSKGNISYHQTDQEDIEDLIDESKIFLISQSRSVTSSTDLVIGADLKNNIITEKKNEIVHVKSVKECERVVENVKQNLSTDKDVEVLEPTSTLKQHKAKIYNKTIQPNNLKRYSCSICEKAFKTHSELKSHMSAHNNARPYICEICGQGYKNKNALDIHVGMHNGINPFTCVYCNKSFTQKGALRRHIPIHTGDAPYQCDLCGKRFVHHTSFHIHQLSHTGQKQYKCNICGLALLSGSHLKRHMRIHTGERNYACPTCGKRFAERYNLVSHQKLHDNSGSSKAGRKTHGCQICGNTYERRVKLEEHLANEHQKLLVNNINQLYSNDVKTEPFEDVKNNIKL